MLLHNHRLERSVPIARDLDLNMPGRFGQHRLRPRTIAHVRGTTVKVGLVLLMTEVLGHLFIQGGLEDRFRELLQQPVRAGQR